MGRSLTSNDTKYSTKKKVPIWLDDRLASIVNPQNKNLEILFPSILHDSSCFFIWNKGNAPHTRLFNIMTPCKSPSVHAGQALALMPPRGPGRVPLLFAAANEVPRWIIHHLLLFGNNAPSPRRGEERCLRGGQFTANSLSQRKRFSNCGRH